MTRVDALIERGADRLQEFANRAARGGGAKAKLAQELADDAAFLRKLKPSLIAARARGRAPTNHKPTAGVVAPGGPEPAKPRRHTGGPNPFVVVGVAFAAGVVLAKVIDWRSRAHGRT